MLIKKTIFQHFSAFVFYNDVQMHNFVFYFSVFYNVQHVFSIFKNWLNIALLGAATVLKAARPGSRTSRCDLSTSPRAGAWAKIRKATVVDP
jgi:hypothetical protein